MNLWPIVLFCSFLCPGGESKNCDGKITSKKPLSVNKMDWNSTKIYCFNGSFQSGQGFKLLMNINEMVSAPILVTVRHGLLFKSWRLPYVDEDSIKHFELVKMFCLSKEDQNSEVMTEVTTPQCGKYVIKCCHLGKCTLLGSGDYDSDITDDYCPLGKVWGEWEECNNKPQFTIQIKTYHDNTHKVELNIPYNVAVPINSPVIHFVDIANKINHDYLNVFIKSDEHCGEISVHHMECPIPESKVENVHNGGLSNWQYMNETGALTINLNTYKKGFFIKFRTYASNCKCDSSSCDITNATKAINITKTFIYNVTSALRGLNQSDNVIVLVGKPVTYYVDLKNVTGYLQVLVKSNDKKCGTVTICPIDSSTLFNENNVGRTTMHWQNMNKTGVLTIDSTNYKEDGGFFIKFTAQASDCICNPPSFKESCGNNLNNQKSFEYTIKLNKSDIEWEIIILIIILVSTVMIFAMVMHFYFTIKSKINHRWVAIALLKSIPSPKHEKFLDKMCLNDNKKAVIFQQNDLYIWMVLLMGITYLIPAFQLVIKYQDIMRTSGNQNTCYYNYLCSTSINYRFNFNHIFSNVGYIIFGLSFFIIVGFKHFWYVKAENCMTENGEKNGIPQYFGIYYALAFALIAEGLLSACFHVCPTQENFQFDTTFMYVTAVLLIVKIYQFSSSTFGN